MASASDIPHRFDVVVNSEGYVLADAETQKAVLGYSPPFVPRTALQGSAYGDSETEFFQTFTQKDWSKGEQQRYQGRDDDSLSRYWTATSIDVRESGSVRQTRASASVTAAAALLLNVFVPGISKLIYAASTTNLYSYDPSGTETSIGAHGLGAAPTAGTGVASDGKNLYLSTTAGGTVGVRKWTGAAFSTFSASGADALAYLNNTLYGYRNTSGTGDLVRYDTAGTLTSLFTWKDAAGSAANTTTTLCPFGGKLLILRNSDSTPGGPELWLYDGTAPAKIQEYDSSFSAHDVCVFEGAAFISGLEYRNGSVARPVIYYYSNGTTGKLWEARTWVSTASTGKPAMTTMETGLYFTDDVDEKLMFYNPSTGGVQSVASITYAAGAKYLASTEQFLLVVNNTTTATRFPASSTATSSTVTSSLIDFDSSLNKRFRSIEVEFDAGSDGNGGSVDVSYRVGDVDGSYTSLVTGATSGSENLLTNITGKSISVKVTLNKGTSTSGPVLKRIKVRAVPVRPAFRRDKFVLNLQGRDGNNLRLRNGDMHVKDGKTMATDLRTVATQTNPFTIIDTFGSYTGVIETLELVGVRPEEFLAIVTAREV